MKEEREEKKSIYLFLLLPLLGERDREVISLLLKKLTKWRLVIFTFI